MEEEEKLSPETTPAPKGRRISKRPAMIASAVLGLTVLASFYGMSAKKEAREQELAERERTLLQQPTEKNTKQLVESIVPGEDTGVIGHTDPLDETPIAEMLELGNRGQVPPTLTQQPAIPEPPAFQPAERTSFVNATDPAQEYERRLKELKTAMAAPAKLVNRSAAPALPQPAKANVAPPSTNLEEQAYGGVPGYTQMTAGLEGQGADASAFNNIQAGNERRTLRREEQLNSGRDQFVSGRELLPTKYTVRPGTVIPGTMISGINSQLPGMIIGQISQNVYDTATGQHLLLPQGSRLVGEYSSDVAIGDERVMVAWRQVVFPDGTMTQLHAMPGADQQGYSGMTGKVTWRFWKALAGAMLISVMSAGVQLALPEQNTGVGGPYYPPPGQLVAGQIAMDLSRLTTEWVRMNAAIRPTINVRPASPFLIMVNQDMVFDSPYSPKTETMYGQRGSYE